MSDKPDNFAVHAIILILGVLAVGGFATICVLAIQRHDIPALLATLVLGVITTLAPSPLHALKSSEPVSVTTAPGDTVAVTETPTADVTANPTPPAVDIHPDAPETSDL